MTEPAAAIPGKNPLRMLFDLQGKRRRLVQVVYLALAVLMGGGLVLFGIGGNTGGGGLLDAVGLGVDGGSQSTSQAGTELTAANKALATNPDDTDALGDKIRAAFQLAKENVNPENGAPTEKSTGYQRQADEAWQKYLELKPDPPDEKSATNPGPKQPDVSLAGYMLQIYDISGLNQPAEAAQAAELVALSRPTVGAYLKLAQYSAAAGQTPNRRPGCNEGRGARGARAAQGRGEAGTGLQGGRREAGLPGRGGRGQGRRGCKGGRHRDGYRLDRPWRRQTLQVALRLRIDACRAPDRVRG